MCNYPYVYKYPEIIYKPSETESSYRPVHKKKKKHHHRKKNYVPGIAETFQFIGCFDPATVDALIKCGMPYEDARKIVRKMINTMVKYC